MKVGKRWSSVCTSTSFILPSTIMLITHTKKKPLKNKTSMQQATRVSVI